jgi:antagonist of KipI
MAQMAFEVLEAEGLISVQDPGRLGWERFGVPRSGPMDAFALRAANALVRNPPECAALEIGMGEALFRARQDCVLAVTGAGYRVAISIWDFTLWGTLFVRGGQTLRLIKTEGGNWAYLALAGGIQVAPALGSRSTYLRGNFGGLAGRRLQAGDQLESGKSAYATEQLLGRSLPPEVRPAYSQTPLISVIPGPQIERFTKRNWRAFLESSYTVSPASDRMGYRLAGPPIRQRGSPDLLSEGMLPGAVQVPADGQPIVMMADSPTSGGYPKLACVASADLPVLAQCQPGTARVRFCETTVEAAQARYRALVRGLEAGIVEPENNAYYAR